MRLSALLCLLILSSAVAWAAPAVPRLTLDQALARLQQHNPTLTAAAEQVRAAQAGLTIAGGRPNPTISMVYPFNGLAETQRAVTVEEPLELGGQRQARLRVAQDKVNLAELHRQDLLRTLRASTRTAFVELAMAQAARRQVGTTVTLGKRLLQVARSRFAAGDVARVDVVRARFALERDKQLVGPADNRVDQARMKLALLLGEPPSTRFEAADGASLGLEAHKPSHGPPLPHLTTLQKWAWHCRPDLLAARGQVRAAADQISLAQANQAPHFALDGTFYWDPTVRSTTWEAGVNLEIPWGDNRSGPVARARATRLQARELLKALELKIQQQVASAYQSYVTAREQVRRDRRLLLPEARKVMNMADKVYRYGQGGLTVALVAHQAFQTQRAAYLTDVQAWQNALTALEKAVNHPLTEQEPKARKSLEEKTP